jgi:hypothetical protein
MVTKFEVHGHLDTARKLRELVTTFLSHEVFHDHPQVSCSEDMMFNIFMLRFMEQGSSVTIVSDY